MRFVSILIVVLALLLAGVVFFVVPRLMNRGAQQALQQQLAVQIQASDVLVATHTLPAGTIIKPEDFRWQRWPNDGLNPNFLVREKGADPQKDVVGHVVLQGILTGEAITAQRLIKPGEAGFLAAALTPGLRAVSIKIDPVTGASGFILPGDHVDVLLDEHYNVAGGGEANVPQITGKDVSDVILRDVRVLALDQTMQDLDSKPKLATTATVEVDIQQAQKLALAGQMGTLALVLRSYSKPARPEGEVGTGVVEDYQVSPYRASLLQQSFTNLAYRQQQLVQNKGQSGLRIYHGATLGAEAQK